MEQKSTSILVAYVAHDRPRVRDMSAIQCFCCKGFGHFALKCPKKFCNYCKKDGHIIKECLIRPPKKSSTAFIVSIGSSSTTSSSVDIAFVQTKCSCSCSNHDSCNGSTNDHFSILCLRSLK